MLKYTVYVHNTSMEEFQELKSSGISIYSEFYLDVSKETGEFVLADLSNGSRIMSIDRTMLTGSNYWRKPMENILYYRNTNFVVLGGSRTGRMLLYWCPSEFGVVLAIASSRYEAKAVIDSFVEKTKEMAEMGIIPWKLVKLIKEVKV